MDFVAEIIHDLLLFTLVMGDGLIVSLVVASLLPDHNPLKQLLNGLCARLGVTLALGGIAMPVEFIPGIDALYDVGTMVFLAYYWFTFFRDAIRIGQDAMRPAPRVRQAPVMREVNTPPTLELERLNWEP